MRILFITAAVTVLIGGLCVAGGIYAYNENTLKGSGAIETEDRPVAGIREVDMEGGYYRVVVTQGTTESLSVTSDDNILAELTTEMAGDVLEISWGDGDGFGVWRVEPTEEVLLELTVTDLQSIDISGSSDLEADRLRGDSLVVDISGSGDVTLRELDVLSAIFAIDGSGDIEADGEAPTQEIDIDGSGRVRAGDLASESVSVDIAGSGDVTVRAAETLDVAIDGSGDVQYYGNPVRTEDISGSGNVIRLDAESAADDTATPAASPAATPQAASTPRVTVPGAGTPRAARQPTATVEAD